MHKSRLAGLVIDTQGGETSSAIDFWARALGWPCLETDEKYGKLATPPDQPDVLIQQVDHPSRVHLDIETDDIEAEVARLSGLGAKVVERLERWTIMEAPTGHRFCVVQPQRPDFEDADNVNAWA